MFSGSKKQVMASCRSWITDEEHEGRISHVRSSSRPSAVTVKSNIAKATSINKGATIVQCTDRIARGLPLSFLYGWMHDSLDERLAGRCKE
jgi:hypothetical protein